ncbi:MAG TPA: tRNA-uridine aminocarboxypropyltransferase [Stellaceae bacterium]|nr:tRNA-uridine aminocarboxypropyltransferase [Stellaceae bacterium]
MDEPACPDCLKPPALCVCAGIERIGNRHFLLILQHPQEQDHALGTARLALRHVARGRLAVGLSWPNLAKAAGQPADPKRWAALYLGSAHPPSGHPLAVVDRHGAPIAAENAILASLDGIVLLDGSWSQAKALWWRNPWLLKLHRIVLDIGRASRYGRVRKEPRRETLSTLEAAAFVLARLEGRPEIEATMNASFEALLRRYREGRAASTGQALARAAASGESQDIGETSTNHGSG